MLLLHLLFNGLQVGALHALTAAGFSLIFGTTRVFHLAHGSTFVTAACVFYGLHSRGVAPFCGVRPLAPMVISYTPSMSLVLIR